jgi:hypothetical protein
LSGVAVFLASFGVLLLLSAFALNLAGLLERVALSYQLLNLVGAGLSAFASVLIGFIPFVVLEGLWTIIAGVAIVRDLAGRRREVTKTADRVPRYGIGESCEEGRN